MPFANVAPGRAPNCSCSSASSWRGANLSCCATSASARPRASRAAASSCPTPVRTASVILAALQRLIFLRLGKAAAQLIGIRLLLHPLAHPALDAHREPQRLGGRRHQLVVARNQLARLADVALAVADLTEADERRGLVGLELERALEERLGIRELVHPQRADAGGRVRAPRRGVKRVADRLQEVLHRGRLAPGLAEEPAEIVIDVGVVRRQAQRALEALLGASLFLHLHVDQAVHAVRRRVVLVGGGRGTQLLQRHPQVAVAVVQGSELGMELGAVAGVADLADDRPGVVVRLAGLSRAGGEQDQHQSGQCPHARTSFRVIRRRVRSATSPASWPQAAAMSSPRVLRVVAVRPARCSTWAKRWMRSGEERLKPEFGNGLNGMRLNLLRTFPARATSSRAWSSLSFTSSSITYSKVMKSRGALSR